MLIKEWFKTKAGSAIVVVASLVLVGTVASANASNRSEGNVFGDSTVNTANRTEGNVLGESTNGNNGYSSDQCKNGAWRDYKNEDGSQKFKNQGQCIKYFKTGEEPNNEHPRHNIVTALFGFLLAFLNWWGNFFNNTGSWFGSLLL